MPAAQHTAWMLLNILSRLDGIVGKIGLDCPTDVQIAGRVVPFSSNTELRQALIEGSREIGIVPLEPDCSFAYILSVGASVNDNSNVTLYVHGEGWWGGISTEPFESNWTPNLPFGPYIAACLAAGEVFKGARMIPSEYTRPSTVCYSTWHHLVTENKAEAWLADGPELLDDVSLNVGLAGVGAVGSAWMHTLWACDGVTGSAVIADNDAAGVESTNLNRYSLFGVSSLGKAKATEAAKIARSAGITWIPFDQGIEELSLPPRVISAVDKNATRQAIQNKYPARILSGSTKDLRAEILRCGPPGVGACLRCFNPPERIASDEEIRSTIDALPMEELEHMADEVGISASDAKVWAREGKCGMAGERLLPYLRRDQGETRQFAVGFVSVMAGTMLAAETIKDVVGACVPLTDVIQRASFQFWEPTASSNQASPYLRDPSCPMCNVQTKNLIWTSRFQALLPLRSTSH